MESDFTATFSLNGGRAPFSVTVINPGGNTILSWTRSNNGNQCTGTNEMSCSVTQNSAAYSHDGTYAITAKNMAANNKEKTAATTFTVTVYKNVTASIIPG